MKINGKILIIDDEVVLRQTLARVLQQAGFEATSAENAEQALAFLKSTAFDLVYLDLRMPGMHGLEVLKLIHEQYPTLPVVLFTAQPDINSAVEALRTGATDYLLKPLKPQVIIERTQTILAAQKKEKRKREITQQIDALQSELRNLEQGIQTNADTQHLPASERFMKCGALVLDLHARRVTIDEQVISLPP
jgi:DNA-binding response OmpR family regulator